MLIRGTRIPYDGNYDADVETKPAPENSDVPKEEQGNGFTTETVDLVLELRHLGQRLAQGLLLPGKKSGNQENPAKKIPAKRL